MLISENCLIWFMSRNSRIALQVARKIAACDMVFIDMLNDNVSNEAVLTMRESHENLKLFFQLDHRLGRGEGG